MVFIYFIFILNEIKMNTNSKSPKIFDDTLKFPKIRRFPKDWGEIVPSSPGYDVLAMRDWVEIVVAFEVATGLLRPYSMFKNQKPGSENNMLFVT